MTDIDKAKKALQGHTIALCKGDKILTSDKKGIAPMIEFLTSGCELNGFSVADMVVGKAAAMLFVVAGIKEVFAKNLSKSGEEYLKKFKIPCSCEVLTDKIINRTGDDICPMEKVVFGVEDAMTGYQLIKNKLEEMAAKEV